MLGRHLSLRRNLDRWAVAVERSLNPSGSGTVGEPLVTRGSLVERVETPREPLINVPFVA